MECYYAREITQLEISNNKKCSDWLIPLGLLSAIQTHKMTVVSPADSTYWEEISKVQHSKSSSIKASRIFGTFIVCSSN